MDDNHPVPCPSTPVRQGESESPPLGAVTSPQNTTSLHHNNPFMMDDPPSDTPPQDYSPPRSPNTFREVDSKGSYAPGPPRDTIFEDIPPLNHTPARNAEEAGLLKLIKAAHFYTLVQDFIKSRTIFSYILGRYDVNRVYEEGKPLKNEVVLLTLRGRFNRLMLFDAAGKCVQDAMAEVREMKPEDVTRMRHLMSILRVPS